MNAITKLLVLSVLVLAAVGCNDTGQRRVRFDLSLAGTDPGAIVLASGATELRLERAQLAFGPLYLCAGRQAGETCETARAEWLGSAVIDLLDPEPARAGELQAVTGEVDSYMYDLGLSSVLTHAEPLTLAAAEQLGGASLWLEGQAQVEAGPTRFTLHLPIAQSGETELGVPVVRSSAGDRFQHEIDEDVQSLELRFDVRPLLAGCDFEAACAERSECGELDPESQVVRAIRQALSAGARPEFVWNPRSE
jgi:hypothetical protein